MPKLFQKKVENFTCLHCNAEVVGNGYTNHCPKCLWSQHVDINPGDRAAICLGMMKPIGIENKKGEWVIIHECEICKYQKRNKVSAEDDIEIITKIAKDVADRITRAR